MRRLQGLGFAVFCLLSGSQWLIESAYPRTLPVLVRESMHYAVIGLVATAISVFSGQSSASAPAKGARVAAAALLLLGLPTLLYVVAHGVVIESGAVLFALVPVFVVIAAAACDPNARGSALMLPALVGLAGALLLLPFQLPSSLFGGLMFAMVFAAVLLTAGGSVWMHALLRGQSIVHIVVVVCSANFVFLGCAALLRGSVWPSASSLAPELLHCMMLDMPQMFLLVWLLRELPPKRLAGRFLIVPLVATIEGVILLRPPLGMRMGLGILLMAAGSAALLFRSEVDDAEALPRLGLN